MEEAAVDEGGSVEAEDDDGGGWGVPEDTAEEWGEADVVMGRDDALLVMAPADEDDDADDDEDCEVGAPDGVAVGGIAFGCGEILETQLACDPAALLTNGGR